MNFRNTNIMYHKHFIAIVGFYLVNSATFVYSSTCDSIDNITLQLQLINNTKVNKTVSGCIDGTNLDETLDTIYIRFQKLPVVLEEGTFTNMKNLRTLSVWSCMDNLLNELEPRVFRNLPNIQNLQISYCALKEIPRDVFNVLPSLQLIRVHNNLIDIVDTNAFANLPLLKKLFFSDNKLEYWSREWFTNSTNIEVMDFQYNQIRTIPRRAFENLKKLHEIYFDYNEISNIQRDAFKGITKLKYLGLQTNRLKIIYENVFPNDLRIDRLLIGGNYLNFLPNELLKRVWAREVRIFNNPWKCPCLDRLYYWLYETNGSVSEEHTCRGGNVPICAYPLSFSKTCIEVVDEQVTKTYVDAIRSLEKPIPAYCIRLD